MYAIVEIAGKQYKVRENDKLIVPRLSGEVDDTITFERVLLVSKDDEDVQIGTPVVPNASVTATIVEHVKGDKVLVFRKKRRKRFKVKRGHRQPYTRIEVSDLTVDGDTKKAKKSSKSTSKKETKEASAKTAKAEKVETENAPTAEKSTKARSASKTEKATKSEKTSDTSGEEEAAS